MNSQPKIDERYTICDSCGNGFRTTAAKYYSCADQICPKCEHKQLRLLLLRQELKSAARFGHTHDRRRTIEGPEEIRIIDGDPVRFLAYSLEVIDCDLCLIQNQIDDILHDGYDWREERDRLIEKTMRPFDRKAGGAIY